MDLIHAHAALPCGYAAALIGRELGIPFVITVHGLDAFSTAQVKGIAGRRCERASAGVYRAASRVICVSEKVQARVEAGALGVRTSVVYNGVDPELFFPAKAENTPARILSVGNLIPIKGQDTLLRALAAIRNYWPSECTIIGEGPEKDRLKALAADLGIGKQVHFLGCQGRRQVAEAMRRCSLFVLPSRFEALGCVYLEAMSCGKTVIACRGQGIEEVIHHGVNGWLVDGGDVQELASALSFLLARQPVRERLGRAARQSILQGFTLVHQAERLAEVYRECLA